MAGTIITLARMVVLGIATLFSLVTIALTGHMYSTFLVKYDFENLSIAVAVLTIISAPVFLVVGFLRKGSLFTMNVVEVPVLGFLSILWLANGALYSEWDAVFYGSTQCNSAFLNSIGQTFCGEFRAVEALSFITWICLKGYAIVTLVLCLIGKSRGNDVWLVGADDVDYFKRNQNQNQVQGSFAQPQGQVQPQYTNSTMATQYTGQQPQMQMGYGQPQQIVQPQFQQPQTMYPPSHGSSPAPMAQV